MSGKKYVCIICPNSCEMRALVSGKEVRVSGNACGKGEEYVRKEIFSPERGLTATLPVRNGSLAMVSVKTSKPIPKGMMTKVMSEISGVIVDAPVKLGDVVISDVLGTGADIIATKNVRFKH